MAARRPKVTVRRGDDRRRGSDLRDVRAAARDGGHAAVAVPQRGTLAQAHRRPLPRRLSCWWRKWTARSSATRACTRPGGDGAATSRASACPCTTTGRDAASGPRCWRRAIDIADNWLNYHRLRLEVYTDNAAAIALYRKFGFEIEGTLREDAFRDGRYVDAYTMGRLRPGAQASGATAAATSATGPTRTANDGDGPQVHRKATKTARKRRSS